jgi:hypothetical protein
VKSPPARRRRKRLSSEAVVSSHYWSPLAVAKRAAEWLGDLGIQRVVDIVLTLNGFGGRIPEGYELIRVDWELPAALRLWRKTHTL